MPPVSHTSRQALILAACLIFAATLSVALGQDIFWDTKNYHLYNAWAFLHDRYAMDIAPASMQSYFSPLLDIPYFWLAQGPLHPWPRVLAGLQGLWYGLLIYVVYRIASHLAQLQQRPWSVADACAVFIGVTGTMAVSQVGSTTNEIALAVLTLFGLYLLLPLLARDRTPSPFRSAFVAGCFCGLAAGLKPTAIVYPPAMALALLLALGIRTSFSWQATLIFGAGVAGSFAVSYGPWAWHLYQTTGSPTFPMFNQLFHSSLTAATAGTDGRFIPRSAAQWLFYPFFWLKKQRDLVTEAPFADPRYALAMLAVAALALAHWSKRSHSSERADRGVRLLTIFAGISFLLWMCLFSILRYAIPIEALTGLLMLAAMRAWRLPQRKWPRLLPTASLLLSVGILATTVYPNWWRGGYAKQVFVVDTGTVEPDSLVILAGSPNAYLAPMFPHADTVGFVGLTWFVRASRGYELWDQVQHRLRDHNGPRYVVVRDDPSNNDDVAMLNEMLPLYRLSDCRAIESNLEVGKRKSSRAAGLRLCRLAWTRTD